MAPSRYRIGWRRRETADTVTVGLDPVDEALAVFEPGQFAMLYAFGVGEVPISVSASRGGTQLVHTIRDVGAVSHALCAAPEGEVLGVRGPFGTTWSAAGVDVSDLVLVAGGVGLAPLRPVVHQVLGDRHRFGRVSLLLGARSPDLLLYTDELVEWSKFVDVQVTVDHATASWSGNVGVVTELLPRARFDPAATLALVCGPEVMMRFAARALLAAGVAPGRIRVSLERNMKCAYGHCGHCQLAHEFVCKDGAVFPYDRVRPLLEVKEL